MYETSVSPTGNSSPELWLDSMAGAVSQLSEEVGASHSTTAPQKPRSFVNSRFPGTPERTGASSSNMVISNDIVVSFAELSIATRVTVVTPTGNTDPLL